MARRSDGLTSHTSEPLADSGEGGSGRSREVQVYEAALRLFREKGYHATSMQDIAEAVGLYKGSLYHYIGGKEDLLLRGFEDAMGALLRDMDEIARDRSLPADEQLRRAIHALVAAIAENLDALTVYLHEWRVFTGETLSRVQTQRERYAELLGLIVARGVSDGVFRGQDVRLTTLGILGMCHWMYQWYRTDGPKTPAQIADYFADLVLNGLRCDRRETVR